MIKLFYIILILILFLFIINVDLNNINIFIIKDIINYNKLNLFNFYNINKKLILSIFYDLIFENPLGFSYIKLIFINYIYEYKFNFINNKFIKFNILLLLDYIINFILKKVFKLYIKDYNFFKKIIINNIIFSIINFFH